jgi:hypothetical protein
VRLTNVPLHSWKGREKEGMRKYATNTLHSVGQNFDALMHNVPMETINDLPVDMQRHVVGVPKPWVSLFWHLTNVVVCYDRVHQPQA